MMMMAGNQQEPKRVIIVGAGMVGLSCAYFLTKRQGIDVTVIERDAVGVGASSGNAGLIAVGHPPIPRPGLIRQAIKWMFDSKSPLYIPPRFEPALLSWLWNFRKACTQDVFLRSMNHLAELGRETMKCFETIRGDEYFNENVTEYRAGGLIDVYKTTEGRDQCRVDADLLHLRGFQIEELSADELHEREPAYRDDVIGGFVMQDSAFANPAKFVTELASCVRQHGVDVRENSRVEKIIVRDGRFVGVRIGGDHGDVLIEGTALILSAGIWSSDLGDQLGLRIPMQAAKGYNVDLCAPGVNLRMAGVLKETFIAVNPIEPGLRLAGTLEFAGLNDRLSKRRLEMLVIGAKQYIRGIEGLERVSEWCGFRPCTADGLPVIGRAPRIQNVFIATGHAMMGFALGPATGRIVGDLLFGGQSSLNVKPYSPNRF